MAEFGFLGLTQDERAGLLEGVARLTGRQSRVLEKDFWVCWVLDRLFTMEGAPMMIFKGGTSLSKVFGAIDRFSEDVDITVDRSGLGLPDDEGMSQSALERGMKVAGERMLGLAESQLVPRLAALEELEVTLEGETIKVAYRSVLGTSGSPCLQEVILVELGARSPVVPWEEHRILPDVAPHFPQLDWPAPLVSVLSPIRTFWEKATLLHLEYHRGGDKPTAERLARHYYDVARLADHRIGREALERLDLLERVAADKKRFFRCGWANYDKARAGTLHLIPPDTRRPALSEDYHKMVKSGMFLGEAPSWGSVIGRLAELEESINRA